MPLIIEQFVSRMARPEWNSNKFVKLQAIMIKSLEQDKNDQAMYKLT